MSPLRFNHVMIRASAGTGKTFQLSNRYLGLVSQGAAVDQILASTFTRKAAGEILDRVLVRLAEAAVSDQTCRALADYIRDSSLSRPRALELLEGLVQNLHRLRISTLDSFFSQIAASLSLELGLPPGWRIVEPSADDRLRTEAIHAVLAESDSKTTLALMHLLTKGEATRSVSDQIRDLVNSLYGLYLETTAKAWQALPRAKGLSGQELEAALQQLASAPPPADKRCVTARDKDLERAQQQDWDSFIAAGISAKVAAGETSYYKKELDPQLLDAYRKLLQHAKAMLVARLADQTEATWQLLEKFDAHYQRLKLARRALRFDDVTRKLSGAAFAGQIEQLSYRLDSRLSHLLLDEFQDTSLLQWNVIRPFADEVFGGAPGRSSFFCVGDVKQAIYGWRGGVAELFDVLGDTWSALQHQALSCSYRSSPAVIETVNKAFENLAGSPVLDNFSQAVQAWAQGFALHSTARSNLPGYARMHVAPRAGDGEKQETITLKFAAEEVARLAREAPDCSVGALVRDNQAVARLIFELRQRGIQASEEGGNPLTDSPAVTVVLSLLTLADHPGDTVARFHVSQSPLGPIVGLDDHADATAAGRVSLSVRRHLLNHGYGPTIYRWARELAQSCDGRDARRLMQLVELAYRYEDDATLRTRDFVHFVESQKVEDPTTAQVRVMTIHQSKGLEFDIVVLPQLDVRLSGQPPAVVVGRPKPTQPVNFVCRYANKELQALLPREVQQIFERQSGQAIRESLCVLYVALSRAAHALHMIIAPSSSSEKNLPATFAGLLRSTLGDGRKAEPGETLYEHGEQDWHVHHSGKAPEAVDKELRTASATASNSASGAQSPPAFKVALAPSLQRRTRGLDRQSPSGLEGGETVDLAYLMRLDAAGALERGTVFHAWFEQIEWLDDGAPAEATLNDAALRLGASQAQAARWLKEFREMLARPATRACLMQSDYARQAPWSAAGALAAGWDAAELSYEVHRERRFAVRDGDAILTGSLDRLVLIHREGRLAAAEVLDFKTDAVKADQQVQLEAAVARYRPQLAAYRRAVAQMTGLPMEHVFARLLFVEPGLVASV
ncbi:MAG TPA: UvrD-helicase domain-containing protein [Pirellulales bacterium]|nr:UvrD-helicase domain-containing protein [Pirellulales bacterium]